MITIELTEKDYQELIEVLEDRKNDIDDYLKVVYEDSEYISNVIKVQKKIMNILETLKNQ